MDLKKTLDAERDVLLHGFPTVNKTLQPRHPVEISEQNHKKQQDNLRLDLLKKTQGIHAPLRIMMERKIVSSVGRLPFMKSSNLMLEVLEGRQEQLDFTDFFKDPMETEIAAPPHLVMEKKLSLL